MEPITGWEIIHRSHFDEITALYEKIRPSYPTELFADILAYLGSNNPVKALEIGAGTGKATEPMLAAGAEVTAIEVGMQMSDYLRQKLSAYPKFKVITAPFEEAIIPEIGYDLIYAANAFHWIDAQIGCPKAYQLLRSHGVLALFRYNGIPQDGDPLYEEIQQAYQLYYCSHYGNSGRPTPDVYGTPEQIKHRFGCDELETYGFTNVTTKLYPWQTTYTTPEYLELLNTFSDHRQLPEANRQALHTAIFNAITRFGGSIVTKDTYQLYMGRKT